MRDQVIPRLWYLAFFTVAVSTAPAAELEFIAGQLGGTGSMDGTGAEARFHSPSGVWVSPTGDAYIADGELNHVVRKVSSAGVVTTIAGLAGAGGTADGVGPDARFQGLYGITGDSAGNLYVADFLVVRKITASGEVFTLPLSREPLVDPNDVFDVVKGPATTLLNPLTNDPVSDTNPVTVTIQVPPVHGAVRVIGSPGPRSMIKMAYTPTGNYQGPDQFIYEFSDGVVDDTATVSLIVTSSPFTGPLNVAADSDGNVYITDLFGNTVQKLATDGTRTVIAGTKGQFGNADGVGAAARFSGPSGIGIDSQNNLYVADRNNYTVRRITPAGVVSTLAGAVGQPGWLDGTGSNARFFGPVGLAVDSTDNIYISDGRIRKVTQSGVVTTLAGGGPLWADGNGSMAGFGSLILGLAAGPDDEIFVCDSSAIRVVTQAGAVTTLAGLNPGKGQAAGSGVFSTVATHGKGIAVNTLGTAFLVGTAGVAQVSPAGEIDDFYPATVDGGVAIAIDSSNQIYVGQNGLIRSVNQAGVQAVLAGSNQYGFADGTGATAAFHGPEAIAVDAAGFLYVADFGNNAVRKVSPAGAVTTIAGTGQGGHLDGPGATAQFYRPLAIAIDAQTTNLYVGESIRIRRIDPAGIVSTVASADSSKVLSDGFFLTPLSGVASIVVDENSNLFVADQFSGTIRILKPNGTHRTFVGVAGEKIVRPGADPRLNNPSELAIFGRNLFIYDAAEGALLSLAVDSVETDGDGVPDAVDNCILVSNTGQVDADGDGYGNACDADFNNDGIVNFVDLATFRQKFGTNDPNADLDSSGFVNFADLARFRSMFGKSAGP